MLPALSERGPVSLPSLAVVPHAPCVAVAFAWSHGAAARRLARALRRVRALLESAGGVAVAVFDVAFVEAVVSLVAPAALLLAVPFALA